MHPLSIFRSPVCLNCLSKWSPWRRMSTKNTIVPPLSKKQQKRKLKEETITQYAGDNSKRADRVYAWGCASTGAIGIPSYLKPEKKGQHPIYTVRQPARIKFMDRANLKVTKVGCGYGFTVYVTTSFRGNRLYGTGINTDSQIGYHEFPRNTGRVLDYVIEPALIDLPLDHRDTTNITQVACGRGHTLVLTDKEGVFTLGNNAYGQCGRPIVEGEVFGQNPRVHKMKDIPDNIAKIVCGHDHSFLLTTDGEVYSCGLGCDGQTGLGHYRTTSQPTKIRGGIEGVKITQIASTGDCVLALSEEGDVFAWGNSEYNQLSIVTDQTQINIPKYLPLKHCGKIIKAASAGSKCAIVNTKGELFVWGYGILGKGPKLESTSEPEMIPPPLFGCNELEPDVLVIDVVCGLHHFVALTNNGSVYTWGKDKHGCLGLGIQRDQYFPLKVSIPAETHSIQCGVDHTVVLCKSFC
ncbi:RCC1-like G exchanging factor-like protein isoform X1 [Mytilus galloprovincialis]|uniref:RCC1-like G exchanging factor-like protein isoform X1 n=1 Tax=Mytilus galloprovincialis TaxID=29158 RepID=UPI003F7B39AB